MNDFLTGSAIFALLLTLGAYQLGLALQKRCRHPLCNPLLIAIILVMAALLLFQIPNSSYQAGCAGISWLLTPATVCLALPLYRQLQTLRGQLPTILLGVAAGTAASLCCILVCASLAEFEPMLTNSLLPKSITTAIGIALAESAGALPSLTTAAIIITGIFGSVVGGSLCKLLHITDPIARGVAFGTAAHVIGTAKANEYGELTGAVSSLSLVVAGILTTVLYPLLIV